MKTKKNFIVIVMMICALSSIQAQVEYPNDVCLSFYLDYIDSLDMKKFSFEEHEKALHKIVKQHETRGYSRNEIYRIYKRGQNLYIKKTKRLEMPKAFQNGYHMVVIMFGCDEAEEQKSKDSIISMMDISYKDWDLYVSIGIKIWEKENP